MRSSGKAIKIGKRSLCHTRAVPVSVRIIEGETRWALNHTSLVALDLVRTTERLSLARRAHRFAGSAVWMYSRE